MDTAPHRYDVVTDLTPRYKTIQEALLQLEHCERQGARFVQRSGDAPFYPYKDVLARAKSAAAAFQALGVRRGDRIAIILPTCIEFMDAFLGAMLAGAIPSALYPPVHLGKLDEYFARTQRMIEKIGARLVVTDRRIRLLLGPLADAVSSFCDIVDADKLSGAAAWAPVEVDADGPAFLQFSSGTTLEPKAVIISHKNLLSNLAMIDELFATFSDEEVERGGVCWLPLYHDMGLIGCMFIGLYHPGTVTYIGPDLFIARPRVWFETLSRYKAVVSAAPDFAYALCTSKIKDEDLNGIDLSHWKIAFNGAEPIDANVVTRFSDRFAKWGLRRQTMTPGYGLAEAGLAVSFSSPSDPPKITEFDATRLAEDGQALLGRGRKIVSVGKPVTGLIVEVQDDAGRPVPDGRVGRIMVRGPSVTPGYYNDPQLSAALIRNNWLDTGDQGFVHDGELHISGRLKDLVIIRGRNYAPQQIEHLVAGVSGLRIASTAAISCPSEGGGERLVVIAERDADCQRTDDELVAEIREKITAGVSLVPGDVRIVKPGTIPRTSSGKLRRSELLRLYQSGRLTAPDKVDGLFLAKKLGKSQLAWGKLWLKKLVKGNDKGSAREDHSV